MIDCKGRTIYPGDLLKSWHFRDGRRQYWLYHVAVMRDGHLFMVPVSDLEPTKQGQGGTCLLTRNMAAYVEIIHGSGPKAGMYYTDRRREKPGTDAGKEAADANA